MLSLTPFWILTLVSSGNTNNATMNSLTLCFLCTIRCIYHTHTHTHTHSWILQLWKECTSHGHTAVNINTFFHSINFYFVTGSPVLWNLSPLTERGGDPWPKCTGRLKKKTAINPRTDKSPLTHSFVFRSPVLPVLPLLLRASHQLSAKCSPHLMLLLLNRKRTFRHVWRTFCTHLCKNWKV